MSVEVRGLSKQFAPGDQPAVQDVTFQAPTGAITGLLGPSGAGKSTVLRLVAGLEMADRGSIAIGGEDCSRTPVAARGVGFVFQNYALFDHLSVRENVAFGLSVRKAPRSEIDDRVQELLRLVQLEPMGDRRPAQLSGGQRQRVAFARALAVRPKVLLLDEPFGALDARVRLELREWLRQLHAETRITTVLVTHDQDEAFEIAEHVVILFDGRVVQAGPPQEIYDRPINPNVAAFVGGANVFAGQVRHHQAQVGTLAVSAPDLREGKKVQVLVRPHDVKLTLPTRRTAGHRVGWITDLRRVGGYVKLTVELPTGDFVQVESSRAEIDAMEISAGTRVVVDFQGAQVFADGDDDYAI